MRFKHHSAPSVAAALVFVIATRTSLAIDVETVFVGDPGNAVDTLLMNDGSTGYGDVAYSFRMGKYEITNDQYVVFLRAVAYQHDPHALWELFMQTSIFGGIDRSGVDGNYTYAVKPNMGNKPVHYVNFWDAARFANWMHNLQPTGPQSSTTTENGAYALNGIMNDGGASIARQPGANWFVPNDDEWYKAAFYDPRTTVAGGPSGNDHYWRWATKSDVAPTPGVANAVGDIVNDGPNVANIDGGADWNGVNSHVTTVGSAGPESASYYGTFDQSGNVGEWNERLAFVGGSYRTGRGGHPNLPAYWASAGERTHSLPTSYGSFRLASVLEPPGPNENFGDFNGDGRADALDFLVWQREFGSTTGGLADANDDNLVNAVDLQAWKDDFGAATTVGHAVPEPHCAMLLAVALAARWKRRRSRS